MRLLFADFWISLHVLGIFCCFGRRPIERFFDSKTDAEIIYKSLKSNSEKGKKRPRGSQNASRIDKIEVEISIFDAFWDSAKTPRPLAREQYYCRGASGRGVLADSAPKFQSNFRPRFYCFLMHFGSLWASVFMISANSSIDFWRMQKTQKSGTSQKPSKSKKNALWPLWDPLWTQYAIRNTEYAIRITHYAIRSVLAPFFVFISSETALRNTEYAIHNT